MNALFVGNRGQGAPPHFSLFGVPVRVELSFLLTTAVLGMGGDPKRLLIWVPCVFVSVLFHEMGHALTYRLLGARSQVVLYGMGGLTFGRREKAFTTGEQVGASLAGPFFGLALGGAFLMISHLVGPFESEWVQSLVKTMWSINIFWSIFNLMPILPMDGGHVMESLLAAVSPTQGRIWARYVSIALSGALAVLSWLAFHDPFMPLILVLFAMQSFQTLSLLRPRTETPAAPPPPPRERPDVIENLGRLHQLLGQDRPLEARAVAFQVLERAEGDGARDAALRALAWIAIGQGEPHEALGYLGKTSRRFDDPFTWGTAIAASGDASKALPHLSQAYARTPNDPQVIAAYARTLVAAGERSQAHSLAGPNSPVAARRALAEALFRSRDYEGAAALSEALFAETHAEVDAYNSACAHARRGQLEAAMNWLERATEVGFRDGAHLATDEDLAALRELPAFQSLLARLKDSSQMPSESMPPSA